MAVFAMIANRCLSPSSKLAVSEWVKKQVYIPNLPQIDVQILYRARDFLLEHQAELERERSQSGSLTTRTLRNQ